MHIIEAKISRILNYYVILYIYGTEHLRRRVIMDNLQLLSNALYALLKTLIINQKLKQSLN